MSDPLLQYRGEFPILSTCTYMVSHSLGAMPRGVNDRLAEFTRMWAERGVLAWSDGWWKMPLQTGELLARILGAAPGSIVMQQNVSLCEAMVASALEYTPKRNKIVYTALNFPSVMYVWEEQKRRGARIEMVASDDGIGVPTQRILDAIDESTVAVPISHVLFKSAFIQDVPAIVEKAHKVGAFVILDVYQSAGTVPLNLTELKVDFATGGSVKWLCGGPGAGYLYVRPDLQDRFRPAITGWAAHAEPFAFEPGPIRYAAGMARWQHGSPAIAPLFQALPGYEIVEKIGVEAIRAKSVRQTSKMIETALAKGWRVNSPRDSARRGGAVIVDVDNSRAVSAELIRRKFIVDHRPGAGIRIAPHFYTTDEECSATLETIEEILRTKAHEPHLSETTAAH